MRFIDFYVVPFGVLIGGGALAGFVLRRWALLGPPVLVGFLAYAWELWKGALAYAAIAGFVSAVGVVLGILARRRSAGLRRRFDSL